MNDRERIAKRVARELRDGYVVNLGIGMPTMVADYVPENVRLILQSENGILGMGSAPDDLNYDPNIVNAGGRPVTIKTGASYFDSAMSFAIIRGGHVDLTILGALQVDERGSLASHIIPGKMIPGMGGAMDLVTGSKRVIVTMTHTAKNGESKILSKLSLPATAIGKVHLIVTELAVIEITENGLKLIEISSDTTLGEVMSKTVAAMEISKQLSFF